MNRLRRPIGPARLRAAAGLAFAAVVLLTGCSQQVAGVVVPRSFVDSVPTSAPFPPLDPPTPAAASPTAAAPTAAVPQPPADKEDVELVDAEDLRGPDPGDVEFTTPSRDISCLMYEDVATCYVRDNTWSPPPRPSQCMPDMGVLLTGTDEGIPACAADPVGGEPAVLGYGEAVEQGGVTCTSRRAGVHCENADTGHGFTVSRVAYALF